MPLKPVAIITDFRPRGGDGRRSRAVWLAVLCLLPLRAYADADPYAYEQEIHKEARMDDGWFDCDEDKDCTVAHIPCQTGIAVSKAHKADAENAVCQAENCYAACEGVMRERSSAVCNEGVCETRFGRVSQPAH